MTFVVAWKYQNELFCIADTAITHPRQPGNPVSSFGESQHKQDDGHTVEETGAKIFRLSDNIAIAYSGVVDDARRFIKLLKGKIGLAPIPKLITEIYREISIQGDISLELIILDNSSSTNPEMIVWKSETPDDPIIDCEFFSIGSLTGSIHSDMILTLQKYMQEYRLPLDDYLAISLGISQTFVIHNNLMQYYAGGAFFGIHLSSNRLKWQDDITYILHPSSFATIRAQNISLADTNSLPTAANFNKITLIIRDNVPVVSSSISGTYKCFLDTNSLEITPDQWDDRWDHNRLSTYFKSMASKYYIFISLSWLSIVIVKTNGGLPDNKFFRYSNLGGDSHQFTFCTELLNLLQRPPPKVGSDEKSFRLEIRDATDN